MKTLILALILTASLASAQTTSGAAAVSPSGFVVGGSMVTGTLSWSYTYEVIPSSLPGANLQPGASILVLITSAAPSAQICVEYRTTEAAGQVANRTMCQAIDAETPASGTYSMSSRLWLSPDNVAITIDRISVTAFSTAGPSTTRSAQNPLPTAQY